MTLKDYYEILGIPFNSSADEIKKAYRQKARLYHPDINPSPDAKDKFIDATVAYEFLITFHEKINNDEEAYHQAMEDWRKYRQDRSNKRAKVYARASYSSFKNTKFYKTTRILDKTSIVITFLVSIMILVYTIYGYTYRLKHPDPILGKPSVFTFIMLILLSLLFLAMSVFYLKSYRESAKKNKKNCR